MKALQRGREGFPASRLSDVTDMDGIADSIRENDPDIRAGMRDELWSEFLQLQRMRMLHLSREQAAELFEV